jgi:hypothetical protein
MRQCSGVYPDSDQDEDTGVAESSIGDGGAPMLRNTRQLLASRRCSEMDVNRFLRLTGYRLFTDLRLLRSPFDSPVASDRRPLPASVHEVTQEALHPSPFADQAFMTLREPSASQ